MSRVAPTAWPRQPDWAWVATVWGGTGRARLGVSPDQLAAWAAGFEGGGLAYLATPPARVPRGRLEAAFWTGVLAQVGITALAPALLEAAVEEAEPGSPLVDRATWGEPILRACALVVVPPILGWRASPEVWADVVAGLRAGLCLATLDGTGRAMAMPRAPVPSRPRLARVDAGGLG